jgi:hypothetical protein
MMGAQSATNDDGTGRPKVRYVAAIGPRLRKLLFVVFALFALLAVDSAYLGTITLETVVRTLNMGHSLTQGTADSDEVWMDVVLRSGDRVVGRSEDRYASDVGPILAPRLHVGTVTVDERPGAEP